MMKAAAAEEGRSGEAFALHLSSSTARVDSTPMPDIVEDYFVRLAVLRGNLPYIPTVFVASVRLYILLTSLSDAMYPYNHLPAQ